MKILVLIVSLLLACNLSFAARYDLNLGLNMKLPSQNLLEKITISSPAAASLSYVITSTEGDSTGVATAVTTGITNPDVPRLITVQCKASCGDVKAGNVIIVGTNIYNAAITDTLTFTANLASAVTSVKAFKTITSVTFPAEDANYTAQWSVGVSDAVGLDKCINFAGDIPWASFNGAFETTHPTCVADADEVEKNVCDPNSALDGSGNLEIYFIQNFRCAP